MFASWSVLGPLWLPSLHLSHPTAGVQAKGTFLASP